MLQVCLLHIAIFLFSIHSPKWHNIQGASLVAQMVKNLPAMQETQVWPLGQEDPLEKGMATYSSILTWRIPWTEESGGPTVQSVAKSQTQKSD